MPPKTCQTEIYRYYYAERPEMHKSADAVRGYPEEEIENSKMKSCRIKMRKLPS